LEHAHLGGAEGARILLVQHHMRWQRFPWRREHVLLEERDDLLPRKIKSGLQCASLQIARGHHHGWRSIGLLGSLALVLREPHAPLAQTHEPQQEHQREHRKQKGNDHHGPHRPVIVVVGDLDGWKLVVRPAGGSLERGLEAASDLALHVI
jgi:hypothetical protein